MWQKLQVLHTYVSNCTLGRYTEQGGVGKSHYVRGKKDHHWSKKKIKPICKDRTYTYLVVLLGHQGYVGLLV